VVSIRRIVGRGVSATVIGGEGARSGRPAVPDPLASAVTPVVAPQNPTRATHSRIAVGGGIAAGQRLTDSLDDTPRFVVTHSSVRVPCKPLTCGNVHKVVQEPPG
jgi:hypothetical protein